MRVSDYFHLGARQPDLDFVDIPIETDVRLFVDPYALHVAPGDWAAEASDRLRLYFERLVQRIRRGNFDDAVDILRGVSEPNDARLGFSDGEPRGSSIGGGKSEALARALSVSGAMRSGRIRDLGEFELLVPNIGRDAVSDITISVIRDLLIAYTHQQCELHGIAMRNTSSGMYWDPAERQWANRYVQLPQVKEARPALRNLLLVPKYIVRRELSLESRDFYEHDVLDYLQAEYASAGQSLGSTVRRPNRSRRSPGFRTKKSVEQQHPFSKEFLLDFVTQHPKVLDDYRARKSRGSKPLSNSSLSMSTGGEVGWDVADLTEGLRDIRPGNQDAEKYEQWVKKALARIFYPALVDPKAKQRMNDGRKVVDIMFSHRSPTGGFARLAANLHLSALRIPFECKNYDAELTNKN